jgi:orotate phosphoribosyltransferase
VGAEPVLAIPVVDRGGAAEAMCKDDGIAFTPLVTARDLGFAYDG